MDFSEIIVQTIVSAPFEENAYLVHRQGREDCFVIDPGLEPDKILTAIEDNNLQLSAMLITHGHADHIGGVGVLKEAWPESLIYIGEEDQNKLTDAELNLSWKFGFPITVPAADVPLQDGQIVDIAGITLEVLHIPGHSVGHVVFLIRTEPRAILFAGDVLFRRGIGRTDFPDGNHRDLILSIKTKLFILPDDTLVYSGHGPTTSLGAEKHGNPDLK